MRFIALGAIAVGAWGVGGIAAEPIAPSDPRIPQGDLELRYWLTNMIVDHRFSHEEVHAATGLTAEQIADATRRLKIGDATEGTPTPPDRVRILPYPGGRHPRIGFQDGAINPQRETKFSAFLPWEGGGYVVVDMPEAIFSNLGLTYLAHTHVPTIWTNRGIELPRQEWQRRPDGSLASERTLPNGIRFAALVVPEKEGVRMELELNNGTKERLTDLRVQNCVMLKAAPGFDQQTNDNKHFQEPYVACRSSGGNRWIVTAWEPCHRAWANPPCPCLHSDPKFPDCEPGETRRVRGWLSFYEGSDLAGELKRLDGLWRASVPEREQ